MATARERTMAKGIGWIIGIALAIVIGVVLLVAIPASFNKQSDDAIQNAAAPADRSTSGATGNEQAAQPGGAAENEPQTTPK
jgi:hypothetical protein